MKREIFSGIFLGLVVSVFVGGLVLALSVFNRAEADKTSGRISKTEIQQDLQTQNPTKAAPDFDGLPGTQADDAPLATGAKPLVTNTPPLESVGGLEAQEPQIGQKDSTQSASLASAEQAETADTALEKYAAAFDDPAQTGQPVLSVILLDDGQGIGATLEGLAVLRDISFPLAFGIDPSAPDARMRMQTYRKYGFETLALLDLPPNAKARDAKMKLDHALEKLDQTVAVIAGNTSGTSWSRDTVVHLARHLQKGGRGMVFQPDGLQTAAQLAVREGVPAKTVFRDFTAKGQNETLMRRFMDQAALRADQSGGAILLGRLRKTTLSALIKWGLQDRAARVALVPVSTQLLEVKLAQPQR